MADLRYVHVEVDTDSYVIEEIAIYAPQTVGDPDPVKTPLTKLDDLAGVFDHSDPNFAEALAVAAADPAKLTYDFNNEYQYTLAEIRANDDLENALAVALMHDPLYNALVAKEQAEAPRHAVYYQYVVEGTEILEVLDITASASPIESIADYFTSEAEAYTEYLKNAVADTKPVLARYAVEFSYDLGADPVNNPDPAPFKAEGTLLPEVLSDLPEFEVCIPVVPKEA